MLSDLEGTLGEGVHFEHTHGAVPEDGLGREDDILPDSKGFLACVHSFPSFGDVPGIDYLHIGIVAEVVGDHGLDGLVDTTLEVHGVGTCGNVLDTHVDDGLGQHGSGSGTVTGLLVGLGSNFLDHLGAHVLVFVLEFDFLCYGDTVLGNVRSTEFLIDYHVAAFRTEGNFDCVCKLVCSLFHLGADVGIEFYLFCHD